MISTSVNFVINNESSFHNGFELSSTTTRITTTKMMKKNYYHEL